MTEFRADVDRRPPELDELLEAVRAEPGEQRLDAIEKAIDGVLGGQARPLPPQQLGGEAIGTTAAIVWKSVLVAVTLSTLGAGSWAVWNAATVASPHSTEALPTKPSSVSKSLPEQAPRIVAAETPEPDDRAFVEPASVDSASVKSRISSPSRPVVSAGSKQPISESALLDEAQLALASNPAKALRLTTKHAHLFPSGTLSQEREVISIDALLRLGKRDLARSRAERFFQRYPRSAHENGLRKRLAFD